MNEEWWNSCSEIWIWNGKWIIVCGEIVRKVLVHLVVSLHRCVFMSMVNETAPIPWFSRGQNPWGRDLPAGTYESMMRLPIVPMVGCFTGCSLEGTLPQFNMEPEKPKFPFFPEAVVYALHQAAVLLQQREILGDNLGIRDKFCSCEGFQLLCMWADDMSYIHTFIICNISTFDLNTQRFNRCYSCLWIVVVSVWSTCKYMWGISYQMILKYLW